MQLGLFIQAYIYLYVSKFFGPLDLLHGPGNLLNERVLWFDLSLK